MFINKCIKNFKENYSKMHLEDIMIDVRADVALDPECQQTKDSKVIAQMPCSSSTLTKRFFLYEHVIFSLNMQI